MRKKQVEESARKAVEYMNSFKREFQKLFPQSDQKALAKFQVFLNQKIRKTAGKNLVKMSKEVKNSFCKKCFTDLSRPNEVTVKDGTKYYGLFCNRCQRVQRKDFINAPKIALIEENKSG